MTQHSHPKIQEATHKRLTLKIKRKKEEGNGQLIVDKVMEPLFKEQNLGFLKRLELYESYTMD